MAIATRSENSLLASLFLVLAVGCGMLACGTTTAGEVIYPDYENGFFHNATPPLPGLRLVRVEDLRGGNPESLGSADIALAEPVADFVKHSLDAMLTTTKPGGIPIDLVVAIQEFQLGGKSSLLGSSSCHFSARLELRLLVSGTETIVGWLQTEKQQDAVFSVLNCEKDAMYSSMAALAQAVGLEDIPLDKFAADIAAGRGESIEKKTLRVAYRQPWLMGSKFGWETGAAYYGFAESEMKDPYGSCFGIRLGVVGWFRARSGFKVAAGYLSGTGTPRRVNPIWTIEKSKVSMYTIPIQASYLYRLRVRDDSRTFAPYVGAGANLFLGIDRLEATASSPTEEFEAHSNAFRASGGVHAILGSEIKLGSRYAGVLEIKWIQCGNGSTGDLLSEEDKALFQSTLYDAVARPTFNFTGWTVELGIRGY